MGLCSMQQGFTRSFWHAPLAPALPLLHLGVTHGGSHNILSALSHPIERTLQLAAHGSCVAVCYPPGVLLLLTVGSTALDVLLCCC
jgi:hypothetical protein